MQAAPPPQAPLGLRVFISYRHDDSQSYARELYQELSNRLPGGQVFWDIGTIAPGLDFVEEIDRAVGSCDVLLAVIGRQWLSMQDAAGVRRLDHAKDFVRLEIATALERGIRVIPVLVQGARMPTEEELPEAIVALARRHATELSDRRWNFDIEQLVLVLQQIQPKPLEPPTGRLVAGASSAASTIASSAGAAPTAPSRGGRGRGTLIGVGVIAALLIAGAAGFFALSSRGGAPASDTLALQAGPPTAAPSTSTSNPAPTVASTPVPTVVNAAPTQSKPQPTPQPPAAKPTAPAPTATPAPAAAKPAAPTANATPNSPAVAQAQAVRAGTPVVTVLHGFTGKEGTAPRGALVQASDGNLYGTTSTGGDDGSGCAHTCAGTVFSLTLQGQFTSLHTFIWPYADGQTPVGGLVEGPDGYLYGVTIDGGAANRGTVYKISRSGDFQKLHDFCQPPPCKDGEEPKAGLTLGGDGNLYGTTSWAGTGGTGTVFRINPSGEFATIFNFNTDTGAAGTSGLIGASDGNLYGVTGTTIYRLTPAGQAAVLYRFDPKKSDGTGTNELVQARDGNLYGVTRSPSAIFRISLDGAYQQVHLLSVTAEGQNPNTLIHASDGNLWTTASAPLIAVSTEGTLITATFLNVQTTGSAPVDHLIQASDGRLYGTTPGYGGFPDGKRGADGTVFIVDRGLPPPRPAN